MGHLMDFASFNGVVGLSESESSSPCDFLTSVVCGVMAGIVPSVGVPLPLPCMIACDTDVCSSSGHVV